jgi:hypothetical protein
MNIKNIIIIILSLYGVGSTIAFIYYLVKYNNIKSNSIDNKSANPDSNEYNNCIKYNNELPNSDSNKVIDSENINNNLNDTKKNKKTYDDSLSNDSVSNDSVSNNENYLKLIQSYDIYNDADFYGKYDLYDEFNDNIIIYSRDLKNCYLSCESLNECYAFTKYNNYCYLKGKYDITQKTNASKTVLVVKKNIQFNQTLPLLNNTIIFPNEKLSNETTISNNTIINNRFLRIE